MLNSELAQVKNKFNYKLSLTTIFEAAYATSFYLPQQNFYDKINLMKDLIQVQNLIHEIRGFKVMLDSDLASLYEVPTHRLNEAVKRNIKKIS